jgi:hypothetical protein
MIDNLPVISFDGVFGVSDISAPVIKPKGKPAISYQMKENERMDMIADRYYDNDRFDKWIALANDIINPLAFCVQDSASIDKAAADKYGSVEAARSTVVFWENNWRDDDSIIPPVVYNALSPRIKQLYDRVQNYRGQVSGYKRKQIDNRKSASTITSNGITVKVIQDDEVPYYSPVTGYDLLERQLTTNRENIQLYTKDQING